MIFLAVNLAAAVGLLLWSVRLIRTGVERAFMPELRRYLKSLSRRPISAAAGGSLAAMLLQSSTVVAAIGGGFAASGMLATPSALALLLGADLGSAAMTKVRLSPVEKIIPFLMLIGIVTFFNASSRKTKQIGRIVIGFALVLVSLQMIRTATAPIGESEIVQAVAAYFVNDLVSAFVIGAFLAWLMHSSLAAILTFATFATLGLIEAPVAATLVIGANLGGAVVPVVLLSSAPRPARQVVLGNLLVRCAVTLAALGLMLFDMINLDRLGQEPGQQVVMLHILVNIALLIVGLAALKFVVRLSDALVPAKKEPLQTSVSALDPKVLDDPNLALACGQRELLRMAGTVQAMLIPVMGLFRNWNAEDAQLIEDREDAIDLMHFETKIYLSKLLETNV